MLKLTRLNNKIVVVNPDHIETADAFPDTTLRLIGGDRIIVRESLDELIEKVVAYRRHVSDARAVATLTVRHVADARDEEEEDV